MSNTPAPAPGFGSLRAEVRNASKFTNEKGETFFFADAEVPAAPGARWSTVRIRVRSAAPIDNGVHDLSVEAYDRKKGEAVCLV